MNLIYYLFISFILANNTDLPVEATEDPEMLGSLEEFIVEFNQTQKETIDAPVADGRSLIPSPFANAPKRIQSLGNQYAMNFLNYAGASYCPQSELERWNCYNCKGYGANTKDVVYVNNKKLESAAFLGVNHDHKLIVISFRGSTNFKNWLTNIKISLVPFRTSSGISVKVHRGFNEAVDSHLPNIRRELLKAKHENPDYNVVFTGHSLGGALTTLSAVKLADEGTVEWDKIQLITFGQPRVGDRGFANYLNSKPVKSARVTTRGDLVPIIPSLLLTNYYHNLYNNHMNLRGNHIPCSNTAEDRKCYFYPLELSIEAHSIFGNQRINSNCKRPDSNPQNWFKRKFGKFF